MMEDLQQYVTNDQSFGDCMLFDIRNLRKIDEPKSNIKEYGKYDISNKMRKIL